MENEGGQIITAEEPSISPNLNIVLTTSVSNETPIVQEDNNDPELSDDSSVESYKIAETSTQKTNGGYYTKRRFHKLFTNPIFIGRVLTLLLTILLLLLSITYCIGTFIY